MAYTLTTEAKADLKEIAKYISDEASIERAKKVVRSLRDEFRKLSAMPGMGHYREDLLGTDYRFWSLYSFVIAYRWNTKPIQIIAVVHGARDLNSFFSERSPTDD